VKGPSASGSSTAFYRIFHLFAVPLLVLGTGAALGLIALRMRGPANCDFADDPLPSTTLFVLAIGGFVAGRYFGVFDRRPRPRLTGTDKAASDRFGQFALVLGLALLPAIWFYEALGTAHISFGGPRLEPITWYVRCAIYHDMTSISSGWITGWIVILVCFLSAQWLSGER
jgi:hypothetical protein